MERERRRPPMWTVRITVQMEMEGWGETEDQS
jgi:hypothetical protein